MKFSIIDFFSKCDQICSLKKSVTENFIFCAVQNKHLLPVGLKSSWGVNPLFARLGNMPPSLGSFARLIIWSHSSSVKKFGISRKAQNYFKYFYKLCNIMKIQSSKKTLYFCIQNFV